MGTLEIRAARLRGQRLDRRVGGDLTGLVRHLLAVQAQDIASFPLAFAARSAGTTVAELADARRSGQIVRCWGPRGTLHLIAADDLGWLYPLVKPAPAGSVRRLRQLGVDADADRAVAVTEAVMSGQGPMTKPRLAAGLARAGLPAEGQAVVHLAMLAASRGLVVLGPDEDGKPTYVLAADWLGAPLPIESADRDTAVRRLVSRYRAAHDPSTPRDLAAWSGLPAGEIERAWGGEPASGHEPAEPAVRLIPAFDEYLLGWRDRDHAVPAELRELIHPGGGIIRAAILLDGQAVGTWRARRVDGRIDITAEPQVTGIGAAIAAETAAIGAFLGLDTRLLD